ncbi:hypothetical protein MKW92_023928, partial [Papaver armeniacum]
DEEYSEEEMEEQDVDIENQYCNSKGTSFYSRGIFGTIFLGAEVECFTLNFNVIVWLKLIRMSIGRIF